MGVVVLRYDAIALGAEEARRPQDVPLGMLGAVGLVWFIYVLMVRQPQMYLATSRSHTLTWRVGASS